MKTGRKTHASANTERAARVEPEPAEVSAAEGLIHLI